MKALGKVSNVVIYPLKAMIEVLVAAFCLFHISHSFSQTTPLYSAEKPSTVVQSVQSEVQAKIGKELDINQRKFIGSAVDAIKETQNALAALNSKNPNKALKALEKATGKLELTLARDPKLSLAPVTAFVVVHDLYTTPERIKELLKTAREKMDAGDIQGARAIMALSGSEIVINVDNIPLATYPQAIKTAALFIEKKQLEQAKITLQVALNTLVITQDVIPLPYLRAWVMLEKIKASDYMKKPDVQDMLKAIGGQIEVAGALGYADQSKNNQLQSQLKDIGEMVDEDKSTQERIKDMQDSLSELMHITSA